MQVAQRIELEAHIRRMRGLHIWADSDVENLSTYEKVTYACMQIIKFIEDKIIKIICLIIPKDKFGADVEQAKFKELESFNTYDSLMKDHFDNFYKRMKDVFDVKNTENTLALFERNIHNHVVTADFKMVYSIICEAEIPEITREEKNILRSLCSLSQVDMTDNDGCSNLSLRDVKLYYNACVKCINYALHTNNLVLLADPVNALKVFESHENTDILQPVHQKLLMDSDRLINLLRNIRRYYAKARVISNEARSTNAQFNVNALNALITNILEKGTSPVTYAQIALLLIDANEIYRDIERYKHTTSVVKYLAMLRMGEKIGIIENKLVIDIVIKICAINLANSDASKLQIKNLLAVHGIDIYKLKEQIKDFACVIHDVLGQIGISTTYMFEHLTGNMRAL